LRLSLLRAFGPQVVNDVLEDLYNHPTGAPSPNEWNNFATVEPTDKSSASTVHCVDDEIIGWLE
jgi:hypothetical protein